MPVKAMAYEIVRVRVKPRKLKKIPENVTAKISETLDTMPFTNMSPLRYLSWNEIR